MVKLGATFSRQSSAGPRQSDAGAHYHKSLTFFSPALGPPRNINKSFPKRYQSASDQETGKVNGKLIRAPNSNNIN